MPGVLRTLAAVALAVWPQMVWAQEVPADGRPAQPQSAADPLPDQGVLNNNMPEGPESAAVAMTWKLSGAAQVIDFQHSALTQGIARNADHFYLLNLDTRGEWSGIGNLQAAYSLRASATWAPGGIGEDGVRLYLREGDLTWTPSADIIFSAGRINYRNGVAYGYNPTDLFRSRASVDEISLDPLVRRESRLGSFMTKSLLLFDRGSVSVVYSPRLADPRPLSYVRPQWASLDLYRTNDRSRAIVKGSYAFTRNFAPELLLMEENGRWSVGANATYGIGNDLIAFAEARSGQQDNMIARSQDFSIATGVFPSGTPGLPGAQRDRTMNDLATGVSYSPTTQLTITLEYDYHGAAPSQRQWSQLVTSAGSNAPLALAELQLLGFYAGNEEEPLSKNSIFLRAGADDVVWPELSVSTFVDVNAADGSGLFQITAAYDVGHGGTISLVDAKSFGGSHSLFGSAAQTQALSVGFALSF